MGTLKQQLYQRARTTHPCSCGRPRRTQPRPTRRIGTAQFGAGESQTTGPVVATQHAPWERIDEGKQSTRGIDRCWRWAVLAPGLLDGDLS